jgi:hypothetical protein
MREGAQRVSHAYTAAGGAAVATDAIETLAATKARGLGAEGRWPHSARR